MFTSNATSFLTLFFTKTYQLFCVTIPGTNITFFQFFGGLFATTIVIGVIKTFLGFGVSASVSGGDGKQYKSAKFDNQYYSEQFYLTDGKGRR